jgi:hypothetical protein
VPRVGIVFCDLAVSVKGTLRLLIVQGLIEGGPEASSIERPGLHRHVILASTKTHSPT